jgi:hypothetical protein
LITLISLSARKIIIIHLDKRLTIGYYCDVLELAMEALDVDKQQLIKK